MATVRFTQTRGDYDPGLVRTYEIEGVETADDAVNMLCDLYERMSMALECCELRRGGQLNENPEQTGETSSNEGRQTEIANRQSSIINTCH
jgi:hypothetical protein